MLDGSSATAAPHVSWADLLELALVLILQQLDDRHHSHSDYGSAACCAHVCSSWSDAVAGGTQGLNMQHCRDMSSLDQWLQRHGTSLQSLHIETAYAMPAALPCPHLEHLQLPVCRPGPADMMSAALQELILHAAAGSPARASAHLGSLQPDSPGSPVSPSAAARRAGYLQQLPQLITLTAPGSLSDADLHRASTLTKLTELSLGHLKHARPACIAGMLQELRGLVRLQLVDLRCNLSASTTPGFAQLTKLRFLRLSWCVVSKVLEPALLQDMTELEELSLSRVKLQAFDMGGSGGDQLLDLLPQLQELTHLTLSNVRGFGESHAAAYAALTSSSKLQHLGLHRFKHNGYGGAVWEHVFDTQLPQLVSLDLSNICPQLLDEDLDYVKVRCPGLGELNMVAALDAASCAWRGLPDEVTRLSALLRHDEDVRLGLYGNTRLQSLYAACSGSMTAGDSIEGLTSLRQLTTLTLEAGGVPDLVNNYPPAHKNWYKAFLGAGPRHFVNKVSCASS